jgi:hypothetical protein
MKVAALAIVLSRYADALEASSASTTASRLRVFIGAFDFSESATVADFADLCTKVEFSTSGDSPLLKELTPTMEGLLQLLRGVAKPGLLADLELLLAVAREQGDIPIVGFASVIRQHVVSASKGRPKKGAAPMNQKLVESYLKRLEAALGNDAAFGPLFRDLEADKCVTKLEAVELATRFMGPTPLSTSRPKALQRVLQRHQKIMDFKKASESIRGGQSAA